MQNYYYSSERAVQIIISLLKQHNIKKVVVSPGATNVTFVASLQQDSWFEMYSSVDERSAAYIACGLAMETGEPIVLTCTGATASRNYIPGLTEAYYSKLPILAITATQNINRIGHLYPQQLDRSVIQKDIAVCSEHIFPCDSPDSEWECNIKVNKAILALKRYGGGPVHLNLTTTYSRDFSIKTFPPAQKIDRFFPSDIFPEIQETKKIALFIGSHHPMSKDLELLIDRFCATYDAVAFCDHTSGYNGKYKAHVSLVAMQTDYRSHIFDVDILIHIGEISGDYPTTGALRVKDAVWRVSPDGEIKDYFRKLRYVFEMKEIEFFSHYGKNGCNNKKYLTQCSEEYDYVFNSLPSLPFSNLWIAGKLAPKLPNNSILHLGILNSLRAWNVYNVSPTIESFSNTGGFGIDGILSTLLGGALGRSELIHFCFLGDLAFFYDLNALGNRHFPKNIRILMVNNGKGTEFRNYNHHGAVFGEKTDDYIAASGHYGNKSKDLVKDYAMNLGFEYISASNKDEFLCLMPLFISKEEISKPILFEIFTISEDESNALKLVNTAVADTITHMTKKAKNKARQLMGENLASKIKKIL